MNVLPRCLLAAVAALPAPAQSLAQSPAPQAAAPQAAAPNETSKRLHAAWLREVLDLDVPGAVAEYQKIAQDQRPAHIERWIAVARLAELERAGVRVEPKPAIADAPERVRTELATLTPVPVAKLLERASSDPAELLQSAGTEAGRFPTMRPVTPRVSPWVREQIGPSLRDRLRTRERVQSLNRPRPDARDPAPFLAADILNVELQGRQERAAALRSLYFSDWKPPATSGDAVATLARVRTNLEAWAQELPQSQQSQQNRLRRLREGIDQRAAVDPAAAVAFVARLPYYAERLFAEPPR